MTEYPYHYGVRILTYDDKGKKEGIRGGVIPAEEILIKPLVSLQEILEQIHPNWVVVDAWLLENEFPPDGPVPISA